MSELNKLRFVVGQYDFFWSARFHDFYAFLERNAKESGFDMDQEPGFRRIKERPKWLGRLGDGSLWSHRNLPRGGYIEPIDWDENDFKEYLDELDSWQSERIKAG